MSCSKEQYDHVCYLIESLVNYSNGYHYEFTTKHDDKITVSIEYDDSRVVNVNGRIVFDARYDGEISTFISGDWIHDIEDELNR